MDDAVAITRHGISEEETDGRWRPKMEISQSSHHKYLARIQLSSASQDPQAGERKQPRATSPTYYGSVMNLR
jgi:hypothetical protein